MYSARRSQIEHKVRAARQRTLTPRGRGPKPAEESIPGATPAQPEPDAKKKGKAAAGGTGSWQLASGDAPGMEADEPELKRSGGTVMALAQYAVLVVGLVMVLIGVLVMVANSHIT